MARNGLAKSEPYLWNGSYLMFNGRMVHRTVWEEHRGSIPKGHLVHHINGDKLDNRIDNLELMTRVQHCKEHRPRLGYRSPVKRVCVLCGQDRNRREVASEPYRGKCNKCRVRERRPKSLVTS